VDAIKRQLILEAILEHEFILDYLGGTDKYRFDAKEYYRHQRHQWTDAEAKENTFKQCRIMHSHDVELFTQNRLPFITRADS
jgi:pyruvate-formate lyase-activating enzyme